MRHRNVVVWLEPPAELLEFDPAEWTTPDDRGSWRPPFRRWQEARHTWLKTHGTETSLGGWLKVLRGEHQIITDPAWQGKP